MRRDIVAVLIGSLLMRAFFLLEEHPIWWDGAVYIGMGKYIASFGEMGL